MTKRIGEHYDYNIRQWTLDSSINANRKGTSINKIIKDAQKFYGYLFPEGGKVKEIKPKELK